jgi:hypothetical protein
MSKVISKNFHGVIDYSYALIVPLLPEIIGFKKQQPASALCRSLGAGAFAYTVFTKARWGLFPVLTFKKHLLIDFSASCFALAAPWLLGFAHKKSATAAVLATGVLGLAASLLTEPLEQPDKKQRYLFI